MFWAEGMAFAGALLLGVRKKRGKRHKTLYTRGVSHRKGRELAGMTSLG